MRLRESRERGSVGLIVVISLLGLSLGILAVSLSYNTANLKAASGASEDMDMQMLCMAGLNRAWAEIEAQNDQDGDGHIGSVGFATPETYRDSRNKALGEYQAWVVNNAADPVNDPPIYLVRVRAAMPTIASPRRRQAAEATVDWTASFLFTPNSGAINITGPLTSTISLVSWNDPDFRIAGNGAPGVVFTDANTMRRFMQNSVIGGREGETGGTLPAPFAPATGNASTVTGNFFSNQLDTKITGTPLTSFDNDLAGFYTEKTFNSPMVYAPTSPFTPAVLNDYRDGLRNYAHGLVSASDNGAGGVNVNYAAAAANGVVVLHQQAGVANGAGAGKPRIVSNLSFGAVGSPKTVLFDTSQFEGGGANVADVTGDAANGRTITGYGTLVIMHPIGSTGDGGAAKMPNLNWTGDVFVIGYDKDRTTGVGKNVATDNMLYIRKADWTVNGNVLVVTKDGTESSLEMSSDLAGNRATLTINGGLMMFGEATTNESEIDIEGNATFLVNGFIGTYGKRAEIECAASSCDFTVNGNMSVGYPGGFTTTLELEVNGVARFNYNQANVQAAIDGLSQLQAALPLNTQSSASLEFRSRGMVSKNTANWAALSAEQANLASTGDPRGVDPALIQANAQ